MPSVWLKDFLQCALTVYHDLVNLEPKNADINVSRSSRVKLGQTIKIKQNIDMAATKYKEFHEEHKRDVMHRQGKWQRNER